jgi:NAD(P)-dependent dehydrogenase (short-subunit alcohol dehydrogenase family)
MYGLPKDRRPTLTEVHKYLWDTPMSHFNQAFEVNTTACFYTLVAFLPLLDEGNRSEPGKRLQIKSQFIVTGSIAAFSRRPGMGFAYAGSKMAAIHIVKQLATMLADWRVDIRVNCFCPGVYPSDMSKVSCNRSHFDRVGMANWISRA